jgi:hypothetical protein
MKTGLAFALATLLAAGAAGAAERTTKIKVGGLWCASCPYIAAQAIEQGDGKLAERREDHLQLR